MCISSFLSRVVVALSVCVMWCVRILTGVSDRQSLRLFPLLLNTDTVCRAKRRRKSAPGRGEGGGCGLSVVCVRRSPLFS